MSGWKTLPEALELDVRRFVEQLRRTKDMAGLTLAQLAEATAYSKSSWERCLNGSQLPPSQAVEALATRAGTDPEQLLALWEFAEATWSDRGRTRREDSAGETEETDVAGRKGVEDEGTAPAEPREPAGPGRAPIGETPGRPRRPMGTAVLAGLGALLTGAAVLAAFAFSGERTSEAENGSSAGTNATQSPVKDVQVSCHGDSCNGKDPVDKGCGGDAWTAASERVEKSYVEVRYSSACRAAWARIKSATPGDRIELVRKDDRTYDEVVPDDANLAAFTFMLGAPTPQQVRACWELKSGNKGCTDFGGSEELPAASPVPS
ncbi:XRE family transcriptional regulator [Streptomyces sp. WMMB303]|uniref:helix-turn-helix domain-containing protein n=1 Tax=Streptomyces sp. WMMB303 TaxID=3034154 RepID=UPI0023EAA708|nr:XRE family transcriptional regulator [Streptomyces sp. WMMB303]MDF4252600.1 DUF2690 domain-containing protein [Streptomyces sp. WMMB303]